jgi:hypothetical protein
MASALYHLTELENHHFCATDSFISGYTRTFIRPFKCCSFLWDTASDTPTIHFHKFDVQKRFEEYYLLGYNVV